MKKVLPVNPEIQGNNMMCYAYPLSILTAHLNVVPWVMENYVIPFSYTPYETVSEVGLRMFYLDACCFSEEHSIQQPIMHQDNYAQSFFVDRSVVDIVIRLIRMNQYVIVFSDDYYLPNSFFGGCGRHFLHETLFYGYDDEREILYALGMDKQNKYGAVTHRFAELETAFRMGDTCDIHGNSELVRRHRVIALNLDDYHGPYPFNSCRLSEGLKAFASGRVSFRQRYLLNLTHCGHLYFGVDYLMFVADLVERRDAASFRHIHHIYEHAAFLQERLHYTINGTHLNDTFLEAFKTQVNRISILRLKAMKLSLIHSEGWPSEAQKPVFRALASSIRQYTNDIRQLVIQWSEAMHG